MSPGLTQELFCAALSGSDATATMRFSSRCIRPGGTLTAMERLDIYRRNVMAAHIEALRRVFPVCLEILAERSFSSLARQYVRDNPSTSPDLNVYGESFAAFLAERTQSVATLAEFRYLPDLARLEWHWHAAYYQADDEAFNFEVFSACSDKADALILHLSHSLGIVVTPFPVYAIWEMHRSSGQRSRVPALAEPQHLCIYRDGWKPVIEPIEQQTCDLLLACRQQRTLGSMAADAALAGSLPDLPALIRRGWIRGFSGPGSVPGRTD